MSKAASYGLVKLDGGWAVTLGENPAPLISGFESSSDAAQWVLAFYQTHAEIARREARLRERDARRLALTAAAFLSGWQPPPGRPVV